MLSFLAVHKWSCLSKYGDSYRSPQTTIFHVIKFIDVGGGGGVVHAHNSQTIEHIRMNVGGLAKNHKLMKLM